MKDDKKDKSDEVELTFHVTETTEEEHEIETESGLDHTNDNSIDEESAGFVQELNRSFKNYYFYNNKYKNNRYK